MTSSVLPAALLPPLLTTRFGWKDSSVVLLGLIALYCGCLVKINYHYADPQNQYQYYTGSVLFFSATIITEGSLMAIIAKTIPPVLNLGYWNAGLLGSCAELLGRTIGNVAFTVYSVFDPVYTNKAMPFFAYVINSPIIALMIITTVVLYPRLTKHMEIKIVHDV